MVCAGNHRSVGGGSEISTLRERKMRNQCNFCGSFDDVSGPCAHCPSLVCNFCRSAHESACKELQKARASGQGQTIRRVGVSAVPAERKIIEPAILGAPYGEALKTWKKPPDTVYVLADQEPKVAMATIPGVEETPPEPPAQS